MGCFLGCFGSSKDGGKSRKRSRNKVQPRDRQRIVSCTPVQSAVPQGASENPTNNSVSQVQDEPEKELSFRTRKKVTFDSNVKTYERVSCDEALDFSMESEGKKREEENLTKSNQSKSSSEDSSITSSSGPYPPNHRYQNWRDSDDEYEGLDHEDSDLDYEEDDDDEDEEEDEDEGLEVNGLFEDDDGKPRRTTSAAHVFTGEVDSSVPICGLHDGGDAKPVGSNPYARDRSLYVHPVLNPVENLTQWKAVKAKGTPPLRPLKENLVSNEEQRASFGSEPGFKELSFSFKSKTDQAKKSMQEIAVDTSLSNWLVSSDTPPVNKTSTIGPNTTFTPENSMSPGSNSWRSHDDRPILGALTVEELKQFSASSSPRKSPSRSPDEMPIIGTVGTYWNHTAKDSGSVSSYKGIPNTTSKYREDKRVNWHSTPFETRLERALNRGVA
ncbi:actin cytoskeleton-regulatory complex protein PAN1 [Corylus avellana]|uniref:actin cytoskeleton-regulatory complex protein PAN1 n=1 Tax=Corylus avellana TaxID=13451 RepID=UPI001E1F7BA4|nr:actin cytoskeleton-regulatory complex protein PAN1 [Corylus avellana]